MADIEMKTPAGFLVKVKAEKESCIVFNQDNEPEVVGEGGQSENSMDQAVPGVLFIGKLFRMVLGTQGYVLARNQGYKLKIPYRLDPGAELRHLSLTCHSSSDQFPIKLRHAESVKTFISQESVGEVFRYMVLDSGVTRIDLVNLRSRYPDAQIVVIKGNKSYTPRQTETKATRVNDDQVRASDLVKNDQAGEMSKNPVFLARLYLRNLELEKVKGLFLRFQMTNEEIQFVRTFLDIMIRNEHNKEELTSSRAELEKLNEVYRLGAMIAADNKIGFDGELDKGVEKAIARDISAIVALYREKAASKDDEIQYWEWEYRLNKIAGIEGKGA